MTLATDHACASNSVSGADLLAERILRTVVGLSLITGAGLKVWSVFAGGLENTILWELVGGSKAVIVALSLAEGALGVLLTTRAKERAVASMLIAMLVVFTAVLVSHQLWGGRKLMQCGCMGAFAVGPGGMSSLWFSLGHNAILALSIWATTNWRTGKHAT